MKKKTIKKVTIYLALVFIFGALLGTIFHEVIGHGLAVIIFGGRITEVCIFTFQFGDSGLSVAPCIFGRINYKFLHEQTPPTIWIYYNYGLYFYFHFFFICLSNTTFKKTKRTDKNNFYNLLAVLFRYNL